MFVYFIWSVLLLYMSVPIEDRREHQSPPRLQSQTVVSLVGAENLTRDTRKSRQSSFVTFNDVILNFCQVVLGGDALAC